jgi:hypothetical protein
MPRVIIKIVLLLAAQAGGSFPLWASRQVVRAPQAATSPVRGSAQIPPANEKKNGSLKQRKLSKRQLIAKLKSSSPQKKKTAIDALVQRGDPGPASAIAPLIQDPDPEVASQACWAVGELRDPKTTPQAVLGLQRNSNPIVRESCAIAVGRIDDPEGAPALNSAASDEKEDIRVRLAAIQALAMTDGERAYSITSLMKNADPRISASAAYSACQLQIPGAVDGVKAMLASSDPETKHYGLITVGLWPEKFSDDLAKTVADSKVSLDNRLLGLNAMESLPEEQKQAIYAKSLAPLVEPDQPPEIQVAAAQILSEVARPEELDRIARDGRRAPELLARLKEIGIPTAPPAAPVVAPRPERDNLSRLEGLLGALVGAVLALLSALLWERFGPRARVDRLRKKLLMEMLTDDRFKERKRRLKTLMRVIGTDRETTTRLLVELGARGSDEDENDDDLWMLTRNHPLKEK